MSRGKSGLCLGYIDIRIFPVCTFRLGGGDGSRGGCQPYGFDDHNSVRAERAVQAPGIARRLHYPAQSHRPRLQICLLLR